MSAEERLPASGVLEAVFEGLVSHALLEDWRARPRLRRRLRQVLMSRLAGCVPGDSVAVRMLSCDADQQVEVCIRLSLLNARRSIAGVITQPERQALREVIGVERHRWVMGHEHTDLMQAPVGADAQAMAAVPWNLADCEALGRGLVAAWVLDLDPPMRGWLQYRWGLDGQHPLASCWVGPALPVLLELVS